MGGTLQASAIKHESASTANLTLASDGKATFGGLIDLGSTGQIKFPATANPSADANTLDDYEEGTCTLVVSDSAGHNATMGVANVWRYTKVGNKVYVTGTLQWTDISSLIDSSRIRITGLPFAALNVTDYRASSSVGSAYAGSFNVTRQSLTFGIDGGNAFIWGTYITGNNEDSSLFKTHLGANGTLYGISITYHI